MIVRQSVGSMIVAAIAMLTLAVPHDVQAEIIQTGDYAPAYPVEAPNPWIIPADTMVKVGFDYYGKVTVTQGSTIQSASPLAVGVWGLGDMHRGELVIQSGGQVAAPWASIGGYPFELVSGTFDPYNLSHGTGWVTVTGTDSSLTVGPDASGLPLFVGYTGHGTLSVESNAQVTADSAIVGMGPMATGRVVVDGARLDATSELLVGAWANYACDDSAKVTIRNGGQVTTGRLQVGGFESGPSELSGIPQAMLDTFGYAHGQGEVTARGNSTLDVVGPAYIGYSGTGCVEVRSGSSATTYQTAVGVGPGSVGTLIVDGASVWGEGTGATYHVAYNADYETHPIGGDGPLPKSGALIVGAYGDGLAVVKHGGQMSADKAVYVGGFPAGELPFSGSIEGHTLNASPDGIGTLIVEDEGSSLATPILSVGVTGTGTLRIRDGGRVDSQIGIVGVEATGDGEVTVSGAQSLWRLSGTDPWPDGFDPLSGPMALGTGTVTVSDGGTIEVGADEDGGSKAALIVADRFTVGSRGANSTVSVANGGLVQSGELVIGGTRPDLGMVASEYFDRRHEWCAGTGTVNITGAGSQWQTGEQDTFVGYSGTGTLNITAGGTLTTASAFLGVRPDTIGSVNVQHDPELPGPASRLSAVNAIVVGAWGTGDLTVSDGGHVSTPTLSIGGFDAAATSGMDALVNELGTPNGTGYVTVDGEYSSLNVTGGDSLYVGYSGAGTLNVTAGGEVTADAAVVGLRPEATGWVNVQHNLALPGFPSRLSASDAIVVGAWGNGNLTVSGGGQVSTQSLSIGGFDPGAVSGFDILVTELGTPNGTGTVIVRDMGSSLEVTGDDTLVVGAGGTGTLQIQDGAVVTSGNALIGSLPGGSGTVDVTNMNARWNVDGDLFVGGIASAAGGTGTLNVGEAGFVDVDGEMTVWQTGTLRGSGTVTVQEPTALHNYGTIAPGSATALGTLTVNGNVVFEPGSTYAVKIGQTGSDKLEVNGDTTIKGGTVRVSPLGTVVGEHDYEIIHAQSVTLPAGSTGFDELDTALLNFSVSDPSLSSDPTSVTLHVAAANFNDPTIARTCNQQQVGGALQQIADGGGNGVTDALQDVDTPEHLRCAYDQLSGQTRPPLAPLALSGTSKFLSTVTGRVQSLETGLLGGLFDLDSSPFSMSGPDNRTGTGRLCNAALPGQSISIGNGSPVLSDSPWGLWGQGYGLFGNRKTEAGAPGYSYNVYGGSVGLDYQFNEKLLAGIVAGLSDGTVDFAGSRDKADFRAMNVGLYDSLTWNRWYVDSVATYADLNYDTERYVDLTGERLTGDLNGYELAAYVEGGYNWNLTPKLLLQPLASLQYTYLHLDSYRETSGVSALAYEAQNQDSFKGSLGARLTQRLFASEDGLRADAQVRGRWVHEFGDNQSSVDTWFVTNPAAVFTVHDAAIARDSALLGAGLSVDLTDQTRLYADYDVRLNADETVHVLSAALQYRW